MDKSTIRTDLAVEAREMWKESADKTTELPGVEARDRDVQGFRTTTVRILNEDGEKELCKPKGTYVTVELDVLMNRENDAFDRGASAVSCELREMLNINDGDRVLVVGLGNPAVTPDAVGPRAARSTMVTNHLVSQYPRHFGSFRPVAVLETGVMGTTGMESLELIRAVTEKLKPSLVIAVDALASRKLSRVCRTVQIADTGITPGSGVGNSRAAIDENALGVRVIAVGVPTVVDAGTLAADLSRQAGVNYLPPEDYRQFGGDMIVTPKDIDAKVGDIAKLVGYSINLALHDGLTVDDINMFLS
ncbi:MAG: GPR endopeptidase [Oscillospiraceae bacterium]|nr:GPR endopeptidase [Oscillospiraceae bacterium]